MKYVSKHATRLTVEQIDNKRLRKNIQKKVRDWVAKLKKEMGYVSKVLEESISTPFSLKKSFSTSSLPNTKQICTPRFQLEPETPLSPSSMYNRLESSKPLPVYFNPYQEYHRLKVPFKMLFCSPTGSGKVCFICMCLH